MYSLAIGIGHKRRSTRNALTVLGSLQVLCDAKQTKHAADSLLTKATYSDGIWLAQSMLPPQ